MRSSGFVSIILVNYNGKRFNKQCIDSILKQNYQNFEIVFVDNQSSDGSVEEVEELYGLQLKKGKIKIIRNDENSGFSGGNNLGVEKSDINSEYICLLNNDTTVPYNWLQELVVGISNDPTLGGIGSVILNKGDEEEPLRLLKNKKGVRQSQFLNGYRDISENELKKRVYYTNFVSGCSFLYKKNILDYPFEKYYFLYHEDTYLNRRIMNLGYRLGIAMNSHVNHFGSGSTGGINSFTMYYLMRNKIINRIVFNNYISGILLLPLYLIEELLCILMRNVGLKMKVYPKVWKWIFINRDKILNTRKMIKKESKLGPRKLFHKHNFSYNLMDMNDIKKNFLNKYLFYCIYPFIISINALFYLYQSIIFSFTNFKK